MPVRTRYPAGSQDEPCSEWVNGSVIIYGSQREAHLLGQGPILPGENEQYLSNNSWK